MHTEIHEEQNPQGWQGKFIALHNQRPEIVAVQINVMVAPSGYFFSCVVLLYSCVIFDPD